MPPTFLLFLVSAQLIYLKIHRGKKNKINIVHSASKAQKLSSVEKNWNKISSYKK